MAEYVVAQASVLIVPTLGKGPDSFHSKLEALLKAQKHEIDVRVNAKTKEMLAEIELAKDAAEKDPIKIKVDTVNVTKKLTEIRHKYEDLSREVKKGLLLDLKITGMSLLPQLAQGLAAANASMVQLSQTALVLPGVISGVASSVGTLLTGVSGLKNAFKEYSDAQKNAAADGQKARNAALNVNNAYRDLNRTIKDAQRSLEDLNAQLRDAPLDEADAIIRVQEARAEAADKAQKSGLQQQKDALNVLKAENELADVRLRNSRLIQDVAEANAKGVAGNAAVVDATDRMSKAMDDASTKAEKLTDSFKQLSPNAQEFVKSIEGMASQWAAFKNATQDRLFDGLGAEVSKLAQNDLPILQDGFSKIAGEINGNFKTAMNSLQTDSNKGFLERIFGNTAAAQGNLDKAITPLTDGLLRLSAVGSDFLPRLADGLADVLTRFNNFVINSEADGSLQKWVEGGLDAFKDLGDSLINIGSILNSLSEAFIGSGGEGLLGSLEGGTARLAEFLKSAEGQEKLTGFFQSARQELAQWRPILDALPDVIANVSAAGQAWANMFMPFLRTAATALGEHPGLVQAVFTAYVAWNGIVPIIKGVEKAVGLANNSVDLFKRATDDAGNKIAGTSGFKGKLNDLKNVIASPGMLITAITTLTTWVGTNLVSAHDEAARAAQRQKDDLDNLRGTLDDVTGAATRATNAMVAKNLRENINEATGKKGVDLTKVVSDPNALVQKVVAGDLQGALAMVKGADAASIEKTDFWNSYQENLKGYGITSDIVARAVNGDPKAVELFAKWQNTERMKKAPPGITDPATLRGLETARIISKTPDLLDVQGQLPSEMQVGSQLSGEIYSNTLGIQQGTSTVQQDATVGYGRVRLKAGTPFDGMGVLSGPQLSADGGGLVTKSAPAAGSPLAQQLADAGVTFRADGPDRFIVRLTQEAANQYLERYAAGGLISGPGNGTSDSILARLSHGEYVINSKSTAKHRGLLDSINSDRVPGFDTGGPVVDPPWMTQARTALDSSGYKAAPVQAPFLPPPPRIYGPSLSETTNNGALNPTTGTMKPSVTAGENALLRGPLGSGTDAKPAAAPAMPAPQKPPTVLTQPKLSTKPFPNASAKPAVPKPVSPPSGGGVITPHIGNGRPGPGTVGPVGTHIGTGAAPGRGGVPNLSIPLPGGGNAQFALNPSGLQFRGFAMPGGQSITYSRDVMQQLGIPQLYDNPGDGSAPVIPQWVNGFVQQFGPSLVASSTSHGSLHGDPGTAGWAVDVTGTPEDMQRLAAYLEAHPEISAMAIHQSTLTGETYGIAGGQNVPKGTYFTTPGGTYADEQTMVHWAPAIRPTDASSGSSNPLSYLQTVLSPSNMPPAGTPTGVMLPQYSYAAPGAGAAGGTGNGFSGQEISLGGIKIKLPTPEEWFKSVAKSWSGILENLTKNAGSIALKFIGSFFGLDLSPILDIANSVMGNQGWDDIFGTKKDGQDQNLPANADVNQIMALRDQLPPEYQAAYDKAVAENPGQAPAILQQVMAMAQQQGVGSAAGALGLLNPDSPPAEVAASIVSAAKARGYSMSDALAILATSYGESGWNPRANGGIQPGPEGNADEGDRAWGLFQQKPKYWKNPQDPNQNIQNFLDALDATNGQGGSIFDRIVSIQKGPPASYYASFLPQAQQVLMGLGGYASGGSIKGAGSGTSDSILARVSHGEYIVRASSAQKHLGLLNAINADRMPKFADGGLLLNKPPVPPPPTAPPPAPNAPAPAPQGPQAGADAGQPAAPAPPSGDPAGDTLKQVGSVLGSMGASMTGATGADAPAGSSPTGDPRSVMASAPQNLDHNLPAVGQGIQAAGSAISSAISTAMSAASVAANGAAPGSGEGVNAASSLVSGLVNAGTGAASGAVNILSSLMVGTMTGGTTAGAYGTPLMPQPQNQQYAGPAVVNNWNGGVHTSNNDEFYQIQQRRELQNASPWLAKR